MPRTIFAAALALAMSAPQALATAIAQVKAAEGQVEVLRNGRWRRAREGTELTIQDSIRTGAEGLAQIEFYDADVEGGAQATTIDLVPESEVSIAHFEISKSLPRQRQGFVDLARGYLRAFTKGWATGSVFSVKAGSTVCGIRGSIADIGFDPVTGNVIFTSLDGEMFTFQIDGVKLPANYSSMNPAQQREVMRTFTARAVAQALDYGEMLKANPNATLPGATPLEVGSSEYNNITSGANYRSRNVSPGLVQQMKSTPITKMVPTYRVIETRTNWGLAGGFPPDPLTTETELGSGLTREEAKDSLSYSDGGRIEKDGGTKKVRNQAFDSLLQAITQELVSSPELNAPVSGQ